MRKTVTMAAITGLGQPSMDPKKGVQTTKPTACTTSMQHHRPKLPMALHCIIMLTQTIRK